MVGRPSKGYALLGVVCRKADCRCDRVSFSAGTHFMGFSRGKGRTCAPRQGAHLPALRPGADGVVSSVRRHVVPDRMGSTLSLPDLLAAPANADRDRVVES